MDVSDIIEYNAGLLNPNDLANSYFCLSKNDPTAGFAYDASQVAGHTYPESSTDISGKHDILRGTRRFDTFAMLSPPSEHLEDCQVMPTAGRKDHRISTKSCLYLPELVKRWTIRCSLGGDKLE